MSIGSQLWDSVTPALQTTSCVYSQTHRVYINQLHHAYIYSLYHAYYSQKYGVCVHSRTTLGVYSEISSLFYLVM